MYKWLPLNIACEEGGGEDWIDMSGWKEGM